MRRLLCLDALESATVPKDRNRQCFPLRQIRSRNHARILDPIDPREDLLHDPFRSRQAKDGCLRVAIALTRNNGIARHLDSMRVTPSFGLTLRSWMPVPVRPLADSADQRLRPAIDVNRGLVLATVLRASRRWRHWPGLIGRRWRRSVVRDGRRRRVERNCRRNEDWWSENRCADEERGVEGSMEEERMEERVEEDRMVTDSHEHVDMASTRMSRTGAYERKDGKCHGPECVPHH
jgi:hypothetical protein